MSDENLNPDESNRRADEKSAKQVREDAVKDDMLDITDLRIAELKAVSRKFVVDGVIKPRLREIFELAAMEIKKSGYAGMLPAGVVLCGGAAQTVGMSEMIRDTLRVPVRIAQPKGVSGLIEEVTSPAYAASVGTILYGAKVGGESRRQGLKSLGNVTSLSNKLLNWAKSFLP